MTTETVESRIARLHQHGIVDMHFDLPMDLYEKRSRTGVLGSDYWPDLNAGNIGVAGIAIYLDDCRHTGAECVVVTGR